jgi:uncharacterized protein
MVMKGQFLERPTLISVGGLVLEGLWHRGDKRPPLLILPPLASDGGSMDHVVAAEIAWAAATAEHPTLRFNYRGVGGSQGSRGDVATSVDDAEAALRLLEENVGGAAAAVVAIGSSDLVAKSLAKRRPSIVGFALVSPRTLSPEHVERWGEPLLVIAGQNDRDLPRAELSQAISDAGGTLELVPGADRHFEKNLSLVGRTLANWLNSLGG